MMKIIIEVSDCMILPAWYGVAWVKYESRKTVCMPIPINVVAAAIRAGYLWLKWGYRSTYLNPRDAYHQGRIDALKEAKPHEAAR